VNILVTVYSRQRAWGPGLMCQWDTTFRLLALSGTIVVARASPQGLQLVC
jgi:hypothetical protein